MVSKGVGPWLCIILVGLLSLLTTEGYDVGLTFLDSAVAKGAEFVSEKFSQGFVFRINYQGGGWCNNVTNCLARRDTRLGSSKQMLKLETFSGMFHNKPKYNPAVDPAMLAGCSAGGLTSILQCDNFRSLLPPTTKVKCLSDAGFFINAKTVIGTSHIEGFYADVVKTHGSAKVLSPACVAKLGPGLCFFPQNMVQYIKTPIFLINAAYDSWQVKNILAPGVADRKGTWRECKLDITKCSSAQLNILQGMFINSCYSHCQTGIQETWLRNDSPLLGNTTIAKAVGDWYYERNAFQKIDCPYPCDKTCHNRVFD
ncbi:Pectinacetylesterase [Cynara cardunculus var. scolymus]|uniref:Pectin acetylesterase n=1 Tax=Cynara cardunculus var. scolymus TaxID=59895 RepID=A0A103XIX7_CYNCS|nr:Pectinacetylesterase [Cynara cardunculus var. scolymus]